LTAVAAAAADLAIGEQDAVNAATSRAAGRSKSSRQKSKGKGGYRRRSRSPADYPQSPLCFYHIRFGDKAHKCVELCAWPGN
jgi:hypothetical protein